MRNEQAPERDHTRINEQPTHRQRSRHAYVRIIRLEAKEAHTMMLMKACPRCSGDLVVAKHPRDDEPLVSCMQCGYLGYRRVVAPGPELIGVAGRDEAA